MIGRMGLDIYVTSILALEVPHSLFFEDCGKERICPFDPGHQLLSAAPHCPQCGSCTELRPLLLLTTTNVFKTFALRLGRDPKALFDQMRERGAGWPRASALLRILKLSAFDSFEPHEPTTWGIGYVLGRSSSHRDAERAQPVECDVRDIELLGEALAKVAESLEIESTRPKIYAQAYLSY